MSEHQTRLRCTVNLIPVRLNADTDDNEDLDNDLEGPMSLATDKAVVARAQLRHLALSALDRAVAQDKGKKNSVLELLGSGAGAVNQELDVNLAVTADEAEFRRSENKRIESEKAAQRFHELQQQQQQQKHQAAASMTSSPSSSSSSPPPGLFSEAQGVTVRVWFESVSGTNADTVFDVTGSEEAAVHMAPLLGDRAFVEGCMRAFVAPAVRAPPGADNGFVALDVSGTFDVQVPMQIKQRVERREKRKQAKLRKLLARQREAGFGREPLPAGVRTELEGLASKFKDEGGAKFSELLPNANVVEALIDMSEEPVAKNAVNDAVVVTTRTTKGAAISAEVLPLPRFLPAVVRFALVPSDPDFPFDLDSIQIAIFYPVGYPGVHPTFVVGGLPDSFCRRVEQELANRITTAYVKPGSEARARPYMMNLMRWLDNRLETMLVEPGSDDESLGIQLVAAQKQKSQVYQPSGSDSDDSSDGQYRQPAWLSVHHMPQQDVGSDGSSDDDDDDDDGDDDGEVDANNPNADDSIKNGETCDGAAAGKATKKGKGKGGKGKGREEQFGTTTAHRGTQLALASLTVRNVGLVECSVLGVVVACNRCRVQSEFRLNASQFHAEQCHNCRAEFTLCFRPEKMHEMGSVLGYLDMEPAGVVRLLETLAATCVFIVTCLECGTNLERAKKISMGLPLKTWQQHCHQCHTPMEMEMGKVEIKKVRVERSAAEMEEIEQRIAKARARKQADAKNKIKDPWMQDIRVGSALPNHGTCNHYKKSKRWLRFPCCGRVFPCTTCHDEGTILENRHEPQWATRMLCGYCSFEQRFDLDGDCEHCGKALGVVRTRHWEGGGGQRDQSRMSRTDKKKYAGKHKTQSQKAKRVGQAGKARIERGRGGGGGGGGGDGD